MKYSLILIQKYYIYPIPEIILEIMIRNQHQIKLGNGQHQKKGWI